MSPSDSEFDVIRKFLKDTSGIALGNDKKYLVKARLEPLLNQHQFASYSELIAKIEGPSGLRLRDSIIEAMTTKETSFNRDGHPFEVFRSRILPELIERRYQRQEKAGLGFGRMRIWSAAASTGQEAFSLAIGLAEYLESPANANPPLNRGPLSRANFGILASDISNQALNEVRKGFYRQRDIERGLDPMFRDKYFQKVDDGYKANEVLCKLIEAKQINLTKRVHDVFGFDLILCRNVLIYFDEAMRKQVVAQLTQALLPQAMLILGSAESLSELPPNLTQHHYGKTLVFQRSGV
jgi:chemotaxis protein methyltransferase CheR